MKKYTKFIYCITFVIILFSGFLQSNAQPREYNIKWLENSYLNSYPTEGIIKNRLSFEGAIYPDDIRLPLFSKSIKLTDNNPKKVFYFDDMIFEELADSLLANIQIPEVLPSNFPKLKYYYGRNEKFLDFEICPLRINENSGKLERLLSFVVRDSIDYNKQVSENIVNIIKNASNSLLAEGDWYKIRITKDGIYKLTFSDIKNMGITNPANIRVYGNGGKQLSFMNSDPRPTDLNECPIYMNKGSDGVFNDGDYILFYAEGPVRWEIKTFANDFYLFKQHIHDYSGATFYFLTGDKGTATQIQTVDNKNLVSNIDITAFTDFGYYEKNLINLIQSGRTWYSTRFDNILFDTTFNFSDLILDEPAKIISDVAGRNGSNRIVRLLADDEEIASAKINAVNITDNLSNYANNARLINTHTISGNSIKIGLRYPKYDESDKAYIDYITINVRRKLKMDGDLLFFRDERSIDTSNIGRFIIENTDANTMVWDITHINNTFRLNSELSGSNLQFKSQNSTLHEYVAFNSSAEFPKPEIVSNDNNGKIPNQNLRGLKTVDYIIVTAEVFKEQAERLANYHRESNKLNVLLVTPEEIYNEFSSGIPDVSALRDFFRYQYDNGIGEKTLKYVLLFGDGSYNNHMNVEGNTNYILTYQSIDSWGYTNSYVTDDFYGLLDVSDDNIKCFGKLEIGVGRFPVKSSNGEITEAEIVVDKVINYFKSDKSDWKSSFCFMGDDGSDGSSEETYHMTQANDLADTVSSYLPGADIKKVLLDAYQQKTSSTGPSYPDAQKELFNILNKGVLVWNYTGHGGPGGITAEKVFQSADVDNLKNKEKLFLFITASCSVSKYDNINMVNANSFSASNSCGELVLLNPDGGAVALFSTTRAVGPGKNFELNTNLYNHLFEKDTTRERKRLGDVIREAKNDMINEYNKLNFALLGDPALVVLYPEYKVFTDSVNHIPVEYGADTLKAYQEVTISGHVAFNDGSEINNFNGFVYPRIYDKEVSVTTLGNDGTPAITYLDQRNILHKGKATVVDGKFTFNFIVPVDISYKTGLGKISYYAENDSIDAQGAFSNIYIGGTSENVIVDNNGPQIDLFMNDERFKDGGMTNDNPSLIARLTDENGINTTGTGIGHDLVGVLDEDHSNLILLNDYYQASEDDFRSGTVLFPFTKLTKGEHSLYLKAWDIFNNSSDATISFYVTDADGIILEKVISFPNPATSNVTFQYIHNAPDEPHDVLLEVFDLTGRVVVRMESNIYEGGFVSTPLEWDLSSAAGGNLQTGVYPYRLRVTTSLGTSYIYEKLIIIK